MWDTECYSLQDSQVQQALYFLNMNQKNFEI